MYARGRRHVIWKNLFPFNVQSSFPVTVIHVAGAMVDETYASNNSTRPSIELARVE